VPRVWLQMLKAARKGLHRVHDLTSVRLEKCLIRKTSVILSKKLLEDANHFLNGA